MSDVAKYVPLLRVCASFVEQYRKQGLYELDSVWLMGLRALTELNFDIAAHPKTVRLPVSDNKTVPFPSDYTRWNKIGLLNSSGEINTLRINNALTTYADNDPNRISKLNSPNINDSVNSTGSLVYENFYLNDDCFNLFGVGGGIITYGECRVDEKANLIILAPDFKYDSILFEYISAPERDIDYKVQTVLQEAIISFIEWKYKLNSAENFYAEVTKARRRLKPVSTQYINQILRESETMKLRS